ncbi:MAG: hypothetical protein KDD21_09395 [Bacteroidetes bacterium]|nr:hypothetical protein [Bacteroidota bacterium]
MPDENYKKALEMAAQMDNSFQKDYNDMRNEDFLKIISMIESSGGQNTNHREIQSGIHEGHRAAGQYGLMPNTMQEIANRMNQDGSLSDELRQVTSLPPDQMKAAIESNPMYERQLAEYLANQVLNRQHGDEEKAAYSWFQGHNLSPQEIQQRNYKEHDYVKKFNEYRDPENFQKLSELMNRKP